MRADLIIHSSPQLLTIKGGRQRGESFGELNIIEDGALAIGGEIIIGVGKSQLIRQQFKAQHEINARGKILMPGFVDPHTHLVWVGDRAAEFEQRIAGASYMQIMKAGGGIMGTVMKTRAASIEEMIASAQPRMDRMLRYGTTTAEAKSGYGLDTTSELKILETIMRLQNESALELTPTFLGAHAIPSEFSDDPQAYADLVSQEMLPAVHAWWLQNFPEEALPFNDVFCEEGAFTLAQSKQIMDAAMHLGFPLKIHADEFAALGGTRLAVDLAAVSADHLVSTPADEIRALGKSGTIAVSLPCTPFGLSAEAYTPASAILEAGGCLAIATDLNPGTAWCESMQFSIALACRYLRITPAQAIVAATINAAAAISHDDRIGSMEEGKQADVLILDIDDYRHLGYRFGTNLVTTVIKKGKVVISDDEHH